MAFFNICAGHGAEDSGAVGPDRRMEKNDNLHISMAVGEELTKRGHTVRPLRNDDSINNTWRVCRDWLEKNSADFSVVFHRNAYNGSVGGVEVWSFDKDTLSCNVAKEMSRAIAEAGGFYNRGRKGNGAAWLSPNVPCIQLEVGFIDNASDNTKFDADFQGIVNAICDTLEEFFPLSKESGEARLNEIIKSQASTIALLQSKIKAVKDVLEG